MELIRKSAEWIRKR